MDMTERRLLLVRAGFTPLPLFGKVPPICGKNTNAKTLFGWDGLQTVTTEMLAMWERTWPDARNTGILTRTMPTLDLDLLNEDAVRAAKDLVLERYEEAGPILVRTGKAPKCCIPFRCNADEAFKKFVVNLTAANGSAEKIEFLANGAQVACFGIHPETRKPYSWFGGTLGNIALTDLPNIREAEAHQLVDDIVELLVRDFGYTLAKERPRKARKTTNGAGDPGDAAEDWGALLDNISAGRELHDSLRDLAAKMVRSGMAGGAAVNALRALMDNSEAPHDARWRERRDDIPRQVDTAERKFRQSDDDIVEPADIDPREEPPIDEPPPEEPAPQYQPRFTLQVFDAIKISNAPNYRIKDILAYSGLQVVWGPPKCGKSFWAFDLVMHVAIGRKYRERKVRQGTVVYIACEGGSGFANRIEAWRRKHLGDHDQAVPFYLLNVALNLVADAKALIAAIRAQVADNPAVIVIDTLNRSLPGDENNPLDMSKYIHAADMLHAAFGCLVLVIHHCGVAKNRPRGHTSLTGAVEGQIAVERDKEGVVRCTVEYMKDTEAGGVIASKLEPVELGTDTEGDPIRSLVVIPTDAGPAGPKLSKTQQFAYDTLTKLLASKDDSVAVLPESELAKKGVPVGTRVCLSDTWRKAFYATYPTDKLDTKKRALLRATMDLMEEKIIEPTAEYVWLLDQRDKRDKSEN